MRMRGLILATAAAVLLPVAPAELYAQDGFLFGSPKAQLTVRAGPVMHRAGGDLFDFFQSELTLDRSDFRAPSLGLDFSIVVHPRLDITLGGSWSSVETRSEFREWVDQDDMPIEQMTKLLVIPVTASLRFYPLSRGTGISELAWLPARTTPYLGIGGGMAWHRVEQSGDFVSDDFSIFTDDFIANGRTPVGLVLAGVDHWFTPRVGLNLEGRYTFGTASGSQDFADFDTIDLSGLNVGVGLALRW